MWAPFCEDYTINTKPKNIPEKPKPINTVTIYEGIGLLEITDDFKPKGLIERFDYWCYKRSLINR